MILQAKKTLQKREFDLCKEQEDLKRKCSQLDVQLKIDDDESKIMLCTTLF